MTVIKLITSRPSDSRSNCNLEMLVFEEGGKLVDPHNRCTRFIVVYFDCGKDKTVGVQPRMAYLLTTLLDFISL